MHDDLMAKVTLVIEFPTLTREDLIQLVVAHDDTYPDQEPPIKPEYVQAKDVILLWASGEFPNVEEIVEGAIEG